MSARTRWIALIVGLLGATVVFHVSLLVFSLFDPSFAVVPDYERRAAEWDDTQRELQRSRELGWTVDLDTTPAKAPGFVEVALQLFDRHGAPIRDADARVETFHNARATELLRGRLQHTQDGKYLAILPMRRPGVWEMRLRIVHGEDTYTGVVRKSVVTAPVRPPSPGAGA